MTKPLRIFFYTWHVGIKTNIVIVNAKTPTGADKIFDEYREKHEIDIYQYEKRDITIKEGEGKSL